jgi:hypothetical protein
MVARDLSLRQYPSPGIITQKTKKKNIPIVIIFNIMHIAGTIDLR